MRLEGLCHLILYKNMKLNLGAGNKKYDGFINLDKYKIFKPDILHDLEMK